MTQTPILDALIRHSQVSKIPLHVPGHKQGALMPDDFASWLGHGAKLDVTELPGLDNLQNPEGCIQESQQLTADYYGSDACFYSVNGSTACVMAAIMAIAPRGGRVLFVNPIHLSAWRGLILADATAQFLSVEIDPQTKVALAPTAEAVQAALHVGPRPNLVYLTSPTYYGVTADVRAIADVVHKHNIPLVVDEAHGAHFGLSPDLPPHSVACGADVVIHSVHKMLPALTQTAWLHCQGNLVDRRRVQSHLQMLQSTSPSYLLMASIDAASAWLRANGSHTVNRSLSRLRETRMPNHSIGQDPFRHFLPTGDLEKSRRIQAELEAHGIYVEFADALGVLSIFGLDVEEKTLRIYCEATRPYMLGDAQTPLSPLAGGLCTAQPEFVCTPREAHDARKHARSIGQAQGSIAGALITPYPPGIPVVWPGQRLSAQLCAVLQELYESGYEVHGIHRDGSILVLDS